MRIGIYGGSFNPVHFGHLTVAKTAIDDLQLDRLLIVPANISPFKVGADSSAPLFDRLALLKATFAPLAKAVVDERELNRGGVSYTIDTVREIKRENPDAELFFVLGADSLEGLSRWKEIDELKKLVTFKAYPRTKESSTEIRSLFGANKVTFNSDAKMVETVRAGVLRKNGFCPCRLPKNPEFFCPCDEFKGQLRDPAYHGLCHCRLYLKPLFFLALCFFTLLFSGCRIVDRRLVLDPGKNEILRVESGERLYFELEENRTTGYSWEASSDDADVEVTIEHVAAEVSKGFCGAPGLAKFCLRVHRGFDGPATVVVQYRRPWEKTPIKSFTLSLYKTTYDQAAWK